MNERNKKRFCYVRSNLNIFHISHKFVDKASNKNSEAVSHISKLLKWDRLCSMIWNIIYVYNFIWVIYISNFITIFMIMHSESIILIKTVDIYKALKSYNSYSFLLKNLYFLVVVVVLWRSEGCLITKNAVITACDMI